MLYRGYYPMFAAILSIIFPGLGQVAISRYLKGIIIFFSIIISLDIALIIIPLVLPEDYLQFKNKLLLLTAIIYIYNLWDIFNLVYFRHRKSMKERKKTYLKQSIIYYLQNDLINAQKELTKAYKLDKDDVNILYYLSKISEFSGEINRNSNLTEKTRQLDFTDKWTR